MGTSKSVRHYDHGRRRRTCSCCAVVASVSAVSVSGMLWAGSLLLSFEGSKYYMVGGMWVIVDGGK